MVLTTPKVRSHRSFPVPSSVRSPQSTLENKDNNLGVVGRQGNRRSNTTTNPEWLRTMDRSRSHTSPTTGPRVNGWSPIPTVEGRIFRYSVGRWSSTPRGRSKILILRVRSGTRERVPTPGRVRRRGGLSSPTPGTESITGSFLPGRHVYESAGGMGDPEDDESSGFRDRRGSGRGWGCVPDPRDGSSFFRVSVRPSSPVFSPTGLRSGSPSSHVDGFVRVTSAGTVTEGGRCPGTRPRLESRTKE